MQKIVVLLCAALAGAPAFAATAQQEKMKTCNAEAARQQLKGEARNSFMKQCLAAAQPAPGQPAPAQPGAAQPAQELTPQQAKMKRCNAEATAKEMKSEARKKFVSECLQKP